jgi:hypothetical protein
VAIGLFRAFQGDRGGQRAIRPADVKERAAGGVSSQVCLAQRDKSRLLRFRNTRSAPGDRGAGSPPLVGR